MSRISKVEYYLGLAQAVSKRSPCSRRKFGAVLIKNDIVIGTGFNGSCRKTLNCGVDIVCLKDLKNEPHLQSYDFCPGVHAEQNCIIQSNPQDRIGSTMYLAPSNIKDGDRPCHLCRRFILQGQIKDIIYYDKNMQIIHETTDKWVRLENEWMESIRDGKT